MPQRRRRHCDPPGLRLTNDSIALDDLIAAGRLHPEIGEIADWTETPRVLASARARRVRGNAVLNLHQADGAAASGDAGCGDAADLVGQFVQRGAWRDTSEIMDLPIARRRRSRP